MKAEQFPNHRITLLQAPGHGKVVFSDNIETPVGATAVRFKSSELIFLPDLDYVGKDRAVFLVEANGEQYQVTVNFWVMPFVPDYDEGNTYCKLQKFGLSDGQPQQFRTGGQEFTTPGPHTSNLTQ